MLESDKSGSTDLIQKKEEKDVEELYLAHSDYYLKIVQSMGDKLFNWGFVLSTSGLAGVVTFIATYCHNNAEKCLDSKCEFKSVIMVFSVGILSIVLSAFFERHRFFKALSKLDDLYNTFWKDTSKHIEFFNEVSAIKDAKCLKYISISLYSISYSAFFTGLYITVCSLEKIFK